MTAFLPRREREPPTSTGTIVALRNWTLAAAAGIWQLWVLGLGAFLALPGVIVTGTLSDHIGREPAAVVTYGVSIFGVNVLRAPLPGLLGTARTASKYAYLAYDAIIRNVPPPDSSGGRDLRALLPFGQDF